MSSQNKDDYLSVAKEAQKKRKKNLLIYFGLVVTLLSAGLLLFIISSSTKDNVSLENQNLEDKINKKLDCFNLDKENEFCKARSRSMTLISSLDKIISDLKNKNVQKWNNESFDKLEKSFEISNRSFNSERYFKSLEELLISETIAQKLLKQGEMILNEGLTFGLDFLNSGKVNEAIRKYKEALLIEPDNPIAKEGIKRANVYNEILSEIDEAEKLIKDNLLDKALSKILSAYTKDNKNKVAKNALIKINDIIAKRDFLSFMKIGNEAISNQNPLDGINAFLSALEIQPNSELAKKGLKRIRIIEKEINIKTLLKQASNNEKDEMWELALSDYKKVLALDKNIEVAQNSILRVSKIYNNRKKIVSYLGDEDRVYDFNIRKNVKKTISEGLEIIKESNPGPNFKKTLQDLITLINKFETPVSINFISDNKTKIKITRIGSFGPFLKNNIYLKPGKYEIIGMRKGYREKRIIIDIKYQNNEKIKVICNEPI